MTNMPNMAVAISATTRPFKIDQSAGERVRGGFLLLKRLRVERLVPAAQRVQKSAVRVRGIREPPVKFAGVVERADGVIQLRRPFRARR